MGGGGRVPDLLRTPLLILVLLALHFALPDAGEGLRLRLLRGISKPLPLRGAEEGLAAPTAAPLPDPFPGRTGVMPVLDLERDKGWLIVGGGARAGVTPGARVAVPAGLLGVVDQVTTHLARVRLLDAEDVQVPVELSESTAGRVLPGGLAQLVGVLRGAGDGARIVSAHLPRAFQRGDVLTSLVDDGNDEPWPVGRVVEVGLRPRVELLASADGASAVLVAGASTPTESLFSRHECAVVLVGAGRVRGALLASDQLDLIAPGCGVHFGNRYLGRVLRVGGGVAHVVGAGDAGSPLDVLCLSDDGTYVPARLLGRGEGRFEILDRPKRLRDGVVRVVTAGGQELVRPGLEVGRGIVDRDRLILEDRLPWPPTVSVSVFRYGDERRRLRRSR